jgi:CRP/FNR family transcriptional regulator, cyclic AMP receptor protein
VAEGKAVRYTEAVAVLRRIPVFASLDPASLKLLAFSSAYLTLQDGETLCSQGDPGDSVFVIDEGEVEVWIPGENGPIHLATFGKHDLLGEIAVICNLPRTANVRALGPLKVLKIEGDVFLQLVTGNPEAALGVMRVLTERLMRFTELYQRMKRAMPEGTCPTVPLSAG